MFGLGITRFLPFRLRRFVEKLSLNIRLRSTPNLRKLRPAKRFNGRHVAVAGLFGTITGLGRAAELVALSLENDGHKVTRVDISRSLHLRTVQSLRDYLLPEDCLSLDISDVVFVINPDHAIFSAFDRDWLLKRCIIGHWIWEIDRLPSFWKIAARSYDEVWAPTALVSEVIETAIPDLRELVRVVPYAVMLDPMPKIVPSERAKVRYQLGIQDNTLVVGYSFAVDSNYYRKNPEDLVVAFLKAFPGRELNVTLLLRSNDLNNRPHERATLERTIGSDSRIQIYDKIRHLAIRDFYAALDTYVSPSRAEGYGLNLVEASQAGLSVICSGWRLTPEIETMPRVQTTSYAIVPVNDPQGHYADIKGAVWSAPDVDEMASLLLEQQRCFKPTHG